MRRAHATIPMAAQVIAFAVTAVGMVLAAALPAAASTTLQQVASALKSSPVYASTATPGYNSHTLDNIGDAPAPVALVELPATALLDTGGDGQKFANELDKLTGHRFILAVAFVTDASGTASYYTATVRIGWNDSNNNLTTAKRLGQSPEDVLSSFGHYTDIWLGDHPGALRPVPAPTASPGGTGSGTSSQGASSGSHGFLKFLGVIILVVICVVGVFLLRRRRRRSTGDITQEHVPDAPNRVDSLLRQVRQKKREVQAGDVQAILDDICKRTTQLFDSLQRFGTEQAVRLAVDYYADREKGRLVILLTTIEQYIYIQNHLDVWGDEGDTALTNGANGFRQFRDSVLAAIRKANKGLLMEFEVNTQILNTTR